MSLSVRARAEHLATFRFVAVHLMETLARWVPGTPEMELKILFGEHIWDAARHADALGKRTHELRAPLHHSLRPSLEYVRILEELAGAAGSAERLHGLYDVLLPGLEARYRRYLKETDLLLDAPSVRVLEDALREMARMRTDSQQVRAELGALRLQDPAWPLRLAQAEGAVGEIVAPAASEARL
jgi:hypothetical protein